MAQGLAVKGSNPRWKWEFLKNSENYLRYDNSSIKGTLCSANRRKYIHGVANPRLRITTDHMQSMKAALLLPMFCGLSVTTVSPAKADELIEMLFGVSGLKPAKHRAYIRWGAHWRHLVNMIEWSCAAAMRPYVKLLWPVAIFCVHIWCIGLSLHTFFFLKMHCELNTNFGQETSIFMSCTPVSLQHVCLIHFKSQFL